MFFKKLYCTLYMHQSIIVSQKIAWKNLYEISFNGDHLEAAPFLASNHYLLSWYMLKCKDVALPAESIQLFVKICYMLLDQSLQWSQSWYICEQDSGQCVIISAHLTWTSSGLTQWRLCQSKFNICVRCDMAFIEPMHRNKPNITYLLTQWRLVMPFVIFGKIEFGNGVLSMARSHYLAYHWFVINQVCLHSPDGNFAWNTKEIKQ